VKAVTMPTTNALRWCSCAHVYDVHLNGGKCRDEDAYGYPCECPSFDSDDDPEQAA
jgi:hypothetical protein